MEVGDLTIPDFNDDFDIFVENEQVFSNQEDELVAGKFISLPEKDDLAEQGV